MTANDILEELRALGRDGYKRVLLNHGVAEPCFGVKIEELQKIRKRIRRDYRLALELYDSGVYDARYLAGLIADDVRMTRKDLQHWVTTADCGPLVGFTVPWVAAGNPHGRSIALEWIESPAELVAAAGWATLACWVAIKDDAELDRTELNGLLERVRRTIHESPDKVRYWMNGFVISVGSYVRELTETALKCGERIGTVTVDMGRTACQVPYAPDSIRKVMERGTVGRKRKSAKC